MTTTEKDMHERSAFGLPMNPIEDNPLFADPTPEELAATEPVEENPIDPPDVETPVEVEEPAEPAAETPVVVEEPAEVAAETPVVEEPASVEELIFGKYKNMEEAQKGYDNLRDLQRRTAERARAVEQENGTVVQHVRQLETTLEQAIPYIKALEERVNQNVDPYAEPAAPAAVTPQQVEQIVAARTQEAVQAQREADAKAASYAAGESAILGFYEKHGISQYDEVDNALSETVLALNAAWDKADTEVNVADPDTLEIVLEASKSPELTQVLRSHPEYIDNDAGMQLARFEAALLRGEQPITQQTRNVPASQVGQRADLPVTESALTGGSPPPAAPDNEWTAAKRANAESRHKTQDSPFFE